ncbi:tRNA preQ1(34) S-adenosylmethionine ribosyltransferase-isomerase QueA [Deinococcus sp. Marseille-Q6407]|uniref:tRNA preQ1(34) S-adenosylmethionine ribosyltransferase-isomerase QueA n=1 Tax=Deinococcus sp. Marseille-Q6407 TaxID=2969223 RepID=UPI0021C0E619|nr:tRNA preQ1(34) S-adenosylmethionine ribosyltransferase-isomerase QueA [Deinococcus sp. Marseille-Q6407]
MDHKDRATQATETAQPDSDAVLAQLHFELPQERIAQTGAEPRDSSRLMEVRADGELRHHIFHDLPQLLRPGDVLVFNQSRVIPARVMAYKPALNGLGGGQIEVMLLREEETNLWSAYLKPARRAGNELWLGQPGGQQHRAEVVGVQEDGARLLRFDHDIKPHLDEIGRLPLPPYIQAGKDDTVWRERYQTVYARENGSVAAPTAGLHFTTGLMAQLREMGVEQHAITLHVGAGTFKPIQGSVSEHVMHAEQYHISPETAAAINRAHAEGRRVVAVGTTTVRALESSVNERGEVSSGEGDTRIFITPGRPVRVPDLLITNLHLPGSTLMLLVAAFAGVDRIQAAYREALDSGYRFYSLGDAMLLENTSRRQD